MTRKERDMELRQLRYFVEICKSGSFSEASRRCLISHQGISLAMIRLEDELSSKLFKRTVRGIELTEAAEYLLPKAIEIIAIADEATENLLYGIKENPSLPLLFSQGVLQEFADSILVEFRELYPETTLRITEETDVFCDISIENQDAEIGMTVGPINNDDKLVAELLVCSPQYTNAVIVHNSHPFAKLEKISIEDMRNVPVVIMNENTRSNQLYAECCRKAGFEPIIAATAGDILSVYYYAETNTHVGISTNALARRLNNSNVTAIPFDTPDLAWRIYLIHRKGAILSPEAKAFKECALKHKLIEPW